MEAIALTDLDWFRQLRRLSPEAPVNFWTPTGWHPKKLKLGERLYFMLKAPVRKVGGYGRFAGFEELPLSEMWDRFGRRSGVESEDELGRRVRNYARKRAKESLDIGDAKVGCIVLRDAEFWEDEEFVEPEEIGVSVPDQVVTFKYIPDEQDAASEEWPTTWWVNQGATYRAHKDLGIVWAPQEGKGGRTFQHHQNVAKLRPGDRILHYSDQKIRAVGTVSSEPVETDQSPDDGRDRWSEHGYQAQVEYHPLDEPIERDAIPLEWRQEEGAPFTSAGELRQGYLYSLSKDFAKKLVGRFPQIGEYFPAVESSPGSDPVSPRPDLQAVCTDFAEKVKDAGLPFGDRHQAFVRDFVVSLATKRLVILTGLSGSGKTQIALQFGRWLSSDDEVRYRIVPVRPDWTGAEALFGYPDALQEHSEDGRRAWHVPDPLAFMLRAARNPDRPYLMVLDEMNLAHVERYFADVISGMESSEGCLPNIRQEGGTWREARDGPAKLPFPKNLFIVGTVNVDETTYMFSPKVLDRANTMEFQVKTDDLDPDIRKPGACAPGDPALIQGFLEIARDEDFQHEHPAARKDEFVEALTNLHRVLDQAFAFGHRVLYEALRFAALHEEAGGESMEAALDTQVLQKILPRLHGSRRQLEPVLETVGKFCWDLTPADGGNPGSAFDPVDPPDGDAVLPRSFDKVQRMTDRLRTNQFVSFTE